MKKTALIIIATLLAVGQEAWATEFITDVMLIGGTKSEVDTLKTTYQKDGWKIIDQDLNAGCGSGSDYIYLLYKTADNYTTGNLTFITDFYISTSSGTAPDDVSYNKHNYHLVPFDGGAHFKSVKGDLNSNCGSSSDDIHLYYIKDKVTNDYEPVSSIVFNTTKSGAVGKNGGTNGYDLNAGCGSGSDYIYMHITKERAHWWNIEKTADGRKCRLLSFTYANQTTNVKAIPAIIEGATVVAIYLNVPFTVFTNLETFYFDKSTEVSTMPKVAGCSNLLHVTTIDGNGNVKEDELPPSITSIPDGRDINDMRAYYVGLSRAKQNLYLVTNNPTDYSSISIALNMRDVWLDFFKGRKDIILRLRSGDTLQYHDGFLLSQQGINVAALSASGKDKLKAWTEKGYEVTSAKVSYTLAWRPMDSETEYAVCLANLVLSKKEE